MRGYRQALNLSYHSPSVLGGNSSGAESCDSQDDVDTSAILGLILSLLPVGCFIGALISGSLSDFAGRKPTIVIGASLVAIGGLLHTAAVNLWMVLLSRIISGIGLGVLYQGTPLYLGEISPEHLRGRVLSSINIYGTSAYFIGTVVNLIVKDYIFGWRISLSVQFVTGTILALGMLLLPRSPRWLVKKSREDEALRILTKIYRDEERAKYQLKEIKSTVTSTNTESLLDNVKYICQWKIIQRVWLGFSLLMLGRLTGGNFVSYFSVAIFCGIGLPGFAVSIAIAVTLVSSMILSLTIIDKLGRKPLFLIGVFLMFVCFILSALLIFAFDLEDGASSVSQKAAGYFVVILICVFLGANAVSCGNVPWIILSEIYPLKGRGFMVSVSSTGFWLGIIIANQIGPVLISSPLNIAGTILLFSSIVLFLFVYILLMMPETKGYTLEEIEHVFSKPWLKRINVVYYLRCGCFWDLIVKRRSRVEQSEETQRLEISMDQISLSSSSSSSDEDSTNLTTCTDKVHSELNSDL